MATDPKDTATASKPKSESKPLDLAGLRNLENKLKELGDSIDQEMKDKMLAQARSKHEATTLEQIGTDLMKVVTSEKRESVRFLGKGQRLVIEVAFGTDENDTPKIEAKFQKARTASTAGTGAKSGKGGGQGRKILVTDNDGNEVEYASAADATRALGIYKENESQVRVLDRAVGSKQIASYKYSDGAPAAPDTTEPASDDTTTSAPAE